MKRRTRNPIEARKTIIELSAPIFNKYGYGGTRMDMIVQATGYQKGGIYKHFSSKLDLAEAAFRFNFKQLKEGYIEKIFQEDNPKKQLLAFVKKYQFFIKNTPIKGGCPILNTATEADDAIKELGILAKEALDEWIVLLSKVIRKGQKEGLFNKTFSANEFAQFIIATIEGAIMMGKLKRDPKLMHKVGDQLINYIEKNICK